MNIQTRIGASVLLIALVSSLPAKLPIQALNEQSNWGMEYTFAAREQTITSSAVNSRETIHLFSFLYAPARYFQLSLSLGSGNFNVDTFNGRVFNGGYGLTPAAGACATTPAFLGGHARLTADFDVLYLNSSDSRDFRYSGPVFNPSAGLLFHIARVINLESGVRWHIINGSMVAPGAAAASFSNTPYGRGYLSLTALSAFGVYFAADFAAAPASAENGFASGLRDASFGLKIGMVMQQEPAAPKSAQEKSNRYFPGYRNMKEQQKKMAEDLESNP